MRAKAGRRKAPRRRGVPEERGRGPAHSLKGPPNTRARAPPRCAPSPPGCAWSCWRPGSRCKRDPSACGTSQTCPAFHGGGSGCKGGRVGRRRFSGVGLRGDEGRGGAEWRARMGRGCWCLRHGDGRQRPRQARRQAKGRAAPCHAPTPHPTPAFGPRSAPPRCVDTNAGRGARGGSGARRGEGVRLAQRGRRPRERRGCAPLCAGRRRQRARPAARHAA
jgi:hypothetical protein